MPIASRTEFKEYCLRRLGKPVIEINVADDQVEDRIDEAIQKWQEYHFDGSERCYVRHEITQDDIDNTYIPVHDKYIGIERILPPLSHRNISGMFSFKYQYMMNEMPHLTKGNMANFHMTMENLDLIDETFGSRGQNIRFNRHTDKLYLDLVWPSSDINGLNANRSPDIFLGDYIVMVAFKQLDPSENVDAFEDMWLKKYATELVRYQWGSNLTKLVGVQLPGGVSLNGDAILAEAKENIGLLEEQMSLNYELPMDFFVA